MKYCKSLTLKDGRSLTLRQGEFADGEAVLECFNAAHAETDFLLTYPEENSFSVEQEAAFLQTKAESNNEIEMLAFVDGILAGTAGIEAVGNKLKIKHRAEFGISVLKAYCGLGIGRALTENCIQCAIEAGYKQLELSVVADNKAALSLYESVGFQEFGRNPKGFFSKLTGYQELVHMRLELLT